MREWIPSPASPKGRLVLAALDAFGRDGFAAVSVADLARAADTTTGPLYRHFESKLGLYALVRGDVERRVLDRWRAARRGGRAGGRPRRRVRLRRPRGVPADARRTDPGGGEDPVAALLTERLAPAPAPLGAMLAAAWRAALAAAADGAPDEVVRTALRALSLPRPPGGS